LESFTGDEFFEFGASPVGFVSPPSDFNAESAGFVSVMAIPHSISGMHPVGG
jgi:hypothetical protein